MAKRNGHETVDHVQDPMVSGEQQVTDSGRTFGEPEPIAVADIAGAVVEARKPRAPLSAQEAVRLILTTLKRVGNQEAQDKVLNAVSALR